MLSKLTRSLGRLSVQYTLPNTTRNRTQVARSFEPCHLPLLLPVNRYSTTTFLKKEDTAGPEEEDIPSTAKKNKRGRGRSVPEIPDQHKEWLAFQNSISVEGFEATTAANLKNAAADEEERQRLTQAGGGLYPPLRYSPEDTERLLAEAYAAIPERAGPRGNRRQKRQRTRWHLVRKIHKKQKKHLVRAHFRKMEERSRRIREVKEVLEEAPSIRQRDREYQAMILKRYLAPTAESLSNEDAGLHAVELNSS